MTAHDHDPLDLACAKMKRSCSFLFLLLALGLISRGAVALPFSRPSPVTTPPKKVGGYEKFLTKLFKNADISGDGKIDLIECYTLILQLYVQLNRQAPIPPPSREKILKLYRDSDVSGDGRISMEEFHHLANVLLTRALTRLVAFKTMLMLGAPLLAEYLVRRVFMGKDWWPNLVSRLVSLFQKDTEKSAKTVETLSSPHLVRTILIVLLMVSLGKVIMAVVSFVLDLITIEDDELYETKQKQRAYRNINWSS
uniref:EF-hand domain-containing protein n=1 Tax=Grammatophora oceanica TaxID=210454 RepID=A0A7S1Y2Y0_9STRA